MPAKKRTLGRPKTLDREHVLNVAMMSYWSDGVSAVSVNEICRRAGVSKPGLYREFGSEDGLKQAALIAYYAVVRTQFQQIIDVKKPFSQNLDALIDLLIIDRDVAGLPKGCLHVDMCNCKEQLGALTVEKVNEFRQQSIALYEDWVDGAKEKGEFVHDTPTRSVALYITEQVGSAMLQQKRGVAAEDIEDFLRMGFSVLV